MPVFPEDTRLHVRTTSLRLGAKAGGVMFYVIPLWHSRQGTTPPAHTYLRLMCCAALTS